jgi:hypothetical protein
VNVSLGALAGVAARTGRPGVLLAGAADERAAEGAAHGDGAGTAEKITTAHRKRRVIDHDLPSVPVMT